MADPAIILDIEPDWGVEPEVSYSFTTVVQDTPYFVEQRRPLLVSPVRGANYKFTEINEQFQRLCNILVEAKDQQICVPIFSEPIFAASIVTGGSSITATTSLTYLWNINHCSYVVLLNFVTGESEMIGVTSVSGQLIRLATNIVGVWIAAQTVIFPAMAAELISMKQSFATDSIGSIEAEFSESVLGAEATGSWVGLEEQTCCETLVPSVDCSEYFNGVNGSSPLETVFTITKYYYYQEPVIQNNMLQLQPVSTKWAQYNLDGVYEFVGEFDFSITGSAVFDASKYYGYVSLQATADYTVYFDWDASSQYYNWSSSLGSDYVETSDTSFKIRLRRNASGDIYAYYWNFGLSQWEFNGDTSGVLIGNDESALQPLLQVYIGDDTKILIDDYIVTLGCDNTQPVTP